MRNLRKNQRPLYYATYNGAIPIKDEYGNDSLEVENTYSQPLEWRANYSSNVGEAATQVFGDISQYSRIISWVGTDCPLKEKDILWIGRSIDEQANYEVVKVADSLNSWLVGLKEIV